MDIVENAENSWPEEFLELKVCMDCLFFKK